MRCQQRFRRVRWRHPIVHRAQTAWQFSVDIRFGCNKKPNLFHHVVSRSQQHSVTQCRRRTLARRREAVRARCNMARCCVVSEALQRSLTQCSIAAAVQLSG